MIRRIFNAVTGYAKRAFDFPAQFWAFALGLVLCWIGAAQITPAAGPLLVGLILVWETTRQDENKGIRR